MDNDKQINNIKSDLKAVLFDLDGTFADTAQDLAEALNFVLKQNDHPTLPFEDIRPIVSNGGIALIKLGFKIDPEHPQFENYREQLLDYYQQNIAKFTQLFSGIEEVLIYLKDNDIAWGIVTNKPAWLTNPLMAALNLSGVLPSQPQCVVSGDTLSTRKPDPETLLHACKLINCTSAETIYIGDAKRDIEAGQNANMQTLVALFGYIGEDDKPLSWGATDSVEQAHDIIDWIENNRTIE